MNACPTSITIECLSVPSDNPSIIGMVYQTNQEQFTNKTEIKSEPVVRDVNIYKFEAVCFRLSSSDDLDTLHNLT